MKKFLSVFLSVVFLSALFVGPAFSESPVMDDSEPVISEDELKEGESVFDLLLSTDEAEAAPLEKESGDLGEDDLSKDDDLPFHEPDTEDDKVQEEEDEKEKEIL